MTGLLRFALPDLGEFSLVEARLETGRTHQIRVHLAHAGCPIVGDPKYGRFELNREMARRGFRRMYRMRTRSSFAIRMGARTRVEAPMPDEFEALLHARVPADARSEPGDAVPARAAERPDEAALPPRRVRLGRHPDRF